jgi:hypothetical protein
MNRKDRDRLMRLKNLIANVPFAKTSGGGGSTATVAGLMGFDADMRAVQPFYARVIDGMVYAGLEGFEEGFDYDDPDELLDVMEQWVKQRGEDGWENANEYSLRDLWRELAK